MKNYVIIGNSAAAIGAVQGIRSVDKDGSITIITDEAYHTYSRPLNGNNTIVQTDTGKSDTYVLSAAK